MTATIEPVTPTTENVMPEPTPAVTVETKRGINLGCGRVIFPCLKPDHHELIPSKLYGTVNGIEWTNVDRNAGPGVDKVIDLFDIPWRTADGEVLPSDTYDYAVLAHIAEHIPHFVIRNGQIVVHDHEYQDGFFAFFGELNRVLKVGGEAYILSPWAWSNAGISDPTHTRYLMPATFNYLVNGATSDTFAYKTGQRWAQIDYNKHGSLRPHIIAMNDLRIHARHLIDETNLLSGGAFQAPVMNDIANDDFSSKESMGMLVAYASNMGNKQLNVINEFCIRLEKAGEDES